MNEKNSHLHFLKPAILLISLIGLIYSNTLESPWFLDDYHNIIHNPKIQISEITTDSIKAALYASPAQKGLYRPISYLTFALNWYLGEDKVWGYHIVNIAIHMLAAITLFSTITLLFQTPRLASCSSENIYFVALLTSALWAIHPIHIQAVTYIVQRMASLAALFYILAVFYFIKARLSSHARYRGLYFSLCGISFLLGVGTKNNAILLPVSLLLIEFIFFRDLSCQSIRIKATGAVLLGGLLVAAFGFLLFLKDNINPLFMGYELRPFSLIERLLSQPRVVLFYLSQIFYPTASRFSIAHDFNISTSFIVPWTTTPAIFLVFFLISLALWRVRKNPFFSFAVLFYFGNHAIESSILPLEMIFEHRNYLPSLFLFLPVSWGIKKLIDQYNAANKWMYSFISISVCAVLVFIGSSTYIRNLDWQSNKSFWQDAVHKAPNSARPLTSLAWSYYLPTGQVEKAIELFLEALDLQCNTTECDVFAYTNLASIYFYRLHDYQNATKYLQKISESFLKVQKVAGSDEKDENTDLLLSHALIKLNQFKKASVHLEQLISQNPDNHRAYYLKGLIFLINRSYSEAFDLFRICIHLNPGNWRYLRDIGACLTQMGYHDRGYWFLKRAKEALPGDIGIELRLADNRCRAGLPEQADEWINLILNEVSPDDLKNDLQKLYEDDAWIPLSYDTVLLISNEIQSISKQHFYFASQLIDLYLPLDTSANK